MNGEVKMSKAIMIVEDEPSFQYLYKIILEEVDYKITHTYCGEEAFSKLEEGNTSFVTSLMNQSGKMTEMQTNM